MNFTPLSLFNFQPLEKSASRQRGILAIAIRSHRIDLSKGAFETLGSPDAVQIGTTGSYLAIWPDVRDGFHVTTSRKAGASICGRENVTRLQGRLDQLKDVDFATHFVILSEPTIEDGKLIYNLENRQVCLRQKRRQQEA